MTTSAAGGDGWPNRPGATGAERRLTAQVAVAAPHGPVVEALAARTAEILRIDEAADDGVVRLSSLLRLRWDPPARCGDALLVALHGEPLFPDSVVRRFDGTLAAGPFDHSTMLRLEGSYELDLRPDLAFGEGLLVHRLVRIAAEHWLGDVGRHAGGGG